MSEDRDVLRDLFRDVVKKELPALSSSTVGSIVSALIRQMKVEGIELTSPVPAPCEEDKPDRPEHWEDLKEAICRSSWVHVDRRTDRLLKELKARGLRLERDPLHLKPCAHCGGQGKFIADNSPTYQFVQCDDCGARTRSSYGGQRKVADAWNRRPGAPG